MSTIITAQQIWAIPWLHLASAFATPRAWRKDTKKAFQLFQRAAEMGNPTDICNLGVCYKKGTGSGSTIKAAELYQKLQIWAMPLPYATWECATITAREYPKMSKKRWVSGLVPRKWATRPRATTWSCRKAKAKRSDVLLVALLEKVAKSEPASIENDNLTVLEQPLFRTPMNKLTPKNRNVDAPCF